MTQCLMKFPQKNYLKQLITKYFYCIVHIFIKKTNYETLKFINRRYY
jgi:hypothetical protein